MAGRSKGLSLLGLAAGLFLASAHAEPPAKTIGKAGPSAEEAADLKVLDQEIGRFDQLAGTISVREEKALVKSYLDGFKDRRLALRADFKRETYLELRWEIDVEYQRTVAWLKWAGSSR
jgi:hypothetical protein